MDRVLIADASAMMRRNLTMVLQKEGYDLVLSENGQDAFQRCLAQPPDLVVADSDLPGMSGFQLCQYLRDYPPTNHVPVILLGTEDSQKALNAALAAGGVEYLTKPVDSNLLIERTAQFLISFPTVGMLVNLDPLLAPIRTGTVLSLKGDRLRLKIEAGLPSSLNSGDEVELSCCDDLDQSLSRRRATLDGAFEESFAFHLLGGVYRTQRRQFFRKEISLPLRYRLAGDFYRVGFAADISGGGVRIQNVTPNAKVGGTIQIELRLAASEPPLTIEGEIVRAAPAPAGGLEIGLAFRQIAPQDKSRLVMFLFGEAIK